jgi:hypothetical protein
MVVTPTHVVCANESGPKCTYEDNCCHEVDTLESHQPRDETVEKCEEPIRKPEQINP